MRLVRNLCLLILVFTFITCGGPINKIQELVEKNDKPAPPAGITVGVVGDRSVPLSWGAAEDYDLGDRVASYRIYTSATSGSGYVLEGSTTDIGYTLNGLAGNSALYIVVSALDSHGAESSYSPEARIDLPNFIPPRPTGLAATAPSPGAITLSWIAAVESDGNDAIASYTVYRSDPGSAGYVRFGSVTDTTCIVTGLSGNTTYSFVVTAVDAGNLESPYSEAAEGTTSNNDPQTPVALAVTGKTTASVTLGWSPAADPDPGDAVSYKVFLAGTSAGPFALEGTTDTAAFTVDGLDDDKTFYFAVSAIDAHGGESARSAVLAGTTDRIPATANPLFSTPGGTYNNVQAITLTCTTPGSAIAYTLDGTDPATSLTALPYTGPLTVSATGTTIRAIASSIGLYDSMVISETYILAAAPPDFSPAAGLYPGTRNVTISCATPGVTIHYTTGDTMPTTSAGTIYTEPGPVIIANTTTLRAIAFRSGFQASSVSTGLYTITGNVSAPVFSVTEGSYGATQSVVISSPTTGSDIRFTIDGSTPTREHGTPYTNAVSITGTTTLRAMAYMPTWDPSTDSTVTIATYTMVCAKPAFSLAGGTYPNNQSVTMTTATANAEIRYTTDGTPPTTVSTLYTTPIALEDLGTTATLQAITVKSSYTNSEAQSQTYTLQAAAPTFSLQSGVYWVAQDVTLSSATSGATIWYTTDGSAPAAGTATEYTGTIHLTASALIRAIASKTGYMASAISSGSYGITGVVPTPTFSVAEGNYTTTQSVTLSCPTANSKIRYTIDGTPPTRSSGTIALGAISIPATTTVRAMAYVENWDPVTDSPTSSATYTITGVTATPVFDVITGTYQNDQSVTISCTTPGRIIHYTTDGSIPSRSNGFTYGSPVNITGSTTLRARAYVDAWAPDSDSAEQSAVYTLVAATPVIAVPGGTYTNTQSVGLTSSTTGAIIRYTTDGTTPSATHGTISSGSASISGTATLQAIAYKSGYTNSGVVSASYTITGVTAKPVFNVAAGTYNNDQSVTISCTTPGSIIHYTIDGSEPTRANGILYREDGSEPTGPVSITGTTTLRARAYVDAWATDSDSAEQIAVYTLVAAPPVIAVPGGTYTNAQSVGLTSATTGAFIRHTTDGSTPTEAHGTIGGSASINGTATLQAIAYKSGYTNSGVVSASYTITGVTATPVFNVTTGTYNNDQSVTITCATDGNIIHYTTDGSIPSRSNGLTYSGAVSISRTTTLRARAYVDAWAPDSDSAEQSAIYTLVAATPVIGVPGGTYTNSQMVGLSSATSNAIVRFTTDGTTPSATHGTICDGSVPIVMTATLQAIAYKSGYTDSGQVSASYVITGPVATPVFSVPGGTYANNQTVTITCATPGAEIRYTVDGSEPSRTNGVLYHEDGSEPTGPVTIATNTTLRAYAHVPGWAADSDASASVIYTIKGATPAFSTAGGTYNNNLNITMTTGTTDAEIRYTIDGSEPTATGGTLYTGPVTIIAGTTLRAIACKAGYENSAEMTQVYTMLTATPVFTPQQGIYSFAQDITITSETGGAQIYYTLDGSEPNDTSGTLYTGGFQVGSDVTIKAIAYKPGYTSSSVSTGTYDITGRVATPVFSVPGGIHNNDQAVTITCATPGAGIRYTVDGSTPTRTIGILYREDGSEPTGPVSITATRTLRAIAYITGQPLDSDSDVLVVTYTMVTQTPVFSVAAGTYCENQSVYITSTTSNATIRYTTDGSEPTPTHGDIYTGSPVLINSNRTLQAIAYKANYANSGVEIASYTITGIVLAPTFTPGPGIYSERQEIEIESTTPGAEIYYTSDGSTPTVSSTLYIPGDPIPLNTLGNHVFRAIAHLNGYTASPVATAVYRLEDMTPPVPGNGGWISIHSHRRTSFWISWSAATDDFSDQDKLKYKIVRSQNDDIGSVLDVEVLGNGTVVKDWDDDPYWQKNAASWEWEVVGCTPRQPCFYAVLTRDEQENTALYTGGPCDVGFELPRVNGSVRAIAHDPATNMMYIGGTFSRVNQIARYGASLDSTTATTPAGSTQAAINDQIFTVIPDGSGGWFIGGRFSNVNGVPRNGVARINRDGSLHPWQPVWQLSSGWMVRALALGNGTVYAGGAFTTTGGTRKNAAAFNATTGVLTDWNPNANNTVYALVLNGNTIYAGGAFNGDNAIGGMLRNRLAALNTTTGAAIATWDPNVTGTVWALARDGGILYVGGEFYSSDGVIASIGTQPRNRIAAISIADGSVSMWNPNVLNGTVRALALSGGLIFVGGSFTPPDTSTPSIGGQVRYHLAAVKTSDGTATTWSPNPDGVVYALFADGDQIYVGGTFNNIAGYPRSSIAAISMSTGSDLAWNPNIEDGVFALAGYNEGGATTIYAGGTFPGMGGVVRNNAAAFNINTGELAPWNPNISPSSPPAYASALVHTLLVHDNKVYLGGGFHSVNGASHDYIAKVDATNGIAESLPLLSGWEGYGIEIFTLALNGSTIYAGGDFRRYFFITWYGPMFGGLTRQMAGAFSALNGSVVATWDANMTGPMSFEPHARTIATYGSTVYIGGIFDTIGGSSGPNLGAVDTTTGSVVAWDPGPNGEVYTLLPTGDSIYVAGEFGTIGGWTRRYLAEIRASNGTATTWNPNPNSEGYVRALAITDSILYAGGDFTIIGGGTRNRLAALQRTGGIATDWDPNVNGSVHTMLIIGNTIYVGGDFTTIGGKIEPHIAAIDLSDATISW